MKTCKTCGEQKKLTEFYYRKDKDWYFTSCKPCSIEKDLARYHSKSIDEKRKLKKSQRERMGDEVYASYHREYKLKRRYDLTVEDFDRLYEAQDGQCGICKEYMESPHVDHNHETGKVRGLLCHGCNSGLGLLKENVNALKRAVEYLS